MVKMKHLKAYERNECPDYLVQEVGELIIKLSNVICPILRNADSNIMLAAFNRLHASVIVSLIADDEQELRNAAIQEVKGLIGNIEDISKFIIIEKPNEN